MGNQVLSPSFLELLRAPAGIVLVLLITPSTADDCLYMARRLCTESAHIITIGRAMREIYIFKLSHYYYDIGTPH